MTQGRFLNTIVLTKLSPNLAWGRYQESLLSGASRWSGADLRGNAKSWGSFYKRSRENLLARIRAKHSAEFHKADHGRLVLIIERKPKKVKT